MKSKICKDCGAGSRPAPYPGPRCATHHRERERHLKREAHENHVRKTYGLQAGQYDQLLEAQGGVCFICRRSNGAARKLAVDHSHLSGHVRGLLCSVDNKILGHLRDDPEAAKRIVEYLLNPPAFKVIGKVKPDERT